MHKILLIHGFNSVFYFFISLVCLVIEKYREHTNNRPKNLSYLICLVDNIQHTRYKLHQDQKNGKLDENHISFLANVGGPEIFISFFHFRNILNRSDSIMWMFSLCQMCYFPSLFLIIMKPSKICLGVNDAKTRLSNMNWINFHHSLLFMVTEFSVDDLHLIEMKKKILFYKIPGKAPLIFSTESYKGEITT